MFFPLNGKSSQRRRDITDRQMLFALRTLVTGNELKSDPRLLP